MIIGATIAVVCILIVCVIVKRARTQPREEWPRRIFDDARGEHSSLVNQDGSFFTNDHR